jgi:hypothetical protein
MLNATQCYLFRGIKPPNPLHDTRLAIFTGRSLKASLHKRPRPSITLKVYPEGHIGPRLDYIVISSLLIERRRLAPL